MRSTLALIVLTVIAPCSFAGAWGYGSFDNDDAMDWVADLSRESSARLLMSTLRGIDPGAEYLEAPGCSQAIASAEVVAAAHGAAAKKLPSEVKKWLKRVKPDVSAELLGAARSAVETCRNSPNSELRELVVGSKLGAPWLADTASLLSRLK